MRALIFLLLVVATQASAEPKIEILGPPPTSGARTPAAIVKAYDYLAIIDHQGFAAWAQVYRLMLEPETYWLLADLWVPDGETVELERGAGLVMKLRDGTEIFGTAVISRDAEQISYWDSRRDGPIAVSPRSAWGGRTGTVRLFVRFLHPVERENVESWMSRGIR